MAAYPDTFRLVFSDPGAQRARLPGTSRWLTRDCYCFVARSAKVRSTYVLMPRRTPALHVGVPMPLSVGYLISVCARSVHRSRG